MNKIKEWLDEINIKYEDIETLKGDASSRIYYKINQNNISYILMDSALDKNSLENFLKISDLLSAQNIPKILFQDREKGYLLLENLGKIHLIDILNQNNYITIYKNIIDNLINIQDNTPIDTLENYDKDFLANEMDLITEWYLKKYLGLHLSNKDHIIIENTIELVSNEILKQPQNTFVHRDFHSKNIMIMNKKSYIIDFQDAKRGAITYDLVSLLKDCYTQFDKDEIEKLALYYRDKKNIEVDDKTFIRWFDFMGLQRHIKILGIFSRLYIRDGKNSYLQYLSSTLEYIIEVGDKYPELRPFNHFMKGIK